MERKEVGQGRNLPSPVTHNLPVLLPRTDHLISTMCGVLIGLPTYIPSSNHSRPFVPELYPNTLIGSGFLTNFIPKVVFPLCPR